MLEQLGAGSRRILAAWVALATRRPVVVVLVAAILSAGALAYTGHNLGIDTSTTEMIAPEVPFRRDAIEFRRAFPAARNPIVAVVDGTEPEVVEQAAQALADALAADEAHFRAVRYTGGEPFFETHGLLYLSPTELADLVDRLAAAQPLLGALADDPSLRGFAQFVRLVIDGTDGDALPEEIDRVFAEAAAVVDATRAGEPGQLSWRALLTGEQLAPPREIVLAEPHLDASRLAPAGDAIAAVRAAADALGIVPEQGLSLRLTGPAVLDHEELQSVRAGATVASILTTIAVATLLIWGLGSLRLIVATVITLLCGLILTAGFATLAIGRLNLISVTFAVLFVGLGVDFGIHLALRYREAVQHGVESLRALHHATLGVAPPLSLSALCAALGFLAFVPTDYRGLAELGVISAGGMVIAWLASLTLMPAILTLMPLRLRPAPRERAPRSPVPRVDRLRIPLLIVAGFAGLAAALALPSVRFDFNPLNLKDPEAVSVVTFTELAGDPRTSPYGIDILVPGLAEAQRVAAQVQRLDLVARAVTLASFVPEHQDENLAMIDDLAFMIGPIVDDPSPLPPPDAEERLSALADLHAALADKSSPGAVALTGALDGLLAAGPAPALLADLDQRLMGALPDLLERLRRLLQAGPVTLEDLPPSLAQAWVNPQGEARVLVQPARPIIDNQELREFAAAVLDEVPTATGTPIVITEAGGAVITAFQEASVLAIILITLVLAIVLRSLRDVLLVLSPLALAVVLTGASAVALDLQLNFANVIVLPLLLGLGVSGAIHVVMRRRGQASDAALFASSTPRAVMFSALTTIASFGSLALSPHRGMASMGQLLTIAILWSLVCTLLVLPALLSVIEARRQRRAAPAKDQAAPARAAADPLHLG